jgi:predicted nucleic acid-binding protein
LSSRLYRQMQASGNTCRGREIDLAIAATAMVRDAELLTLNPKDFGDIPGLRLTPL